MNWSRVTESLIVLLFQALVMFIVLATVYVIIWPALAPAIRHLLTRP